MNSFEINKIAGAIFVAGIAALGISLTVNALYDPAAGGHGHEVTRGYEIEVSDIEGTAEVKEDVPVNIAAFFADASLDKGKALSKACVACHSFDKGGANKVGPNLYGIVGSPTANKSDYSYSNALASFDGQWNFQELSQFLEKPKKYVPNTKMAYAGMRKPEQRASLLLYLRSLSDVPLPLPPTPEPEAENEADAEPDADSTSEDKTAQDKIAVEDSEDDAKADGNKPTDDKEAE